MKVIPEMRCMPKFIYYIFYISKLDIYLLNYIKVKYSIEHLNLSVFFLLCSYY